MPPPDMPATLGSGRHSATPEPFRGGSQGPRGARWPSVGQVQPAPGGGHHLGGGAFRPPSGRLNSPQPGTCGGGGWRASHVAERPGFACIWASSTVLGSTAWAGLCGG